MSGDEDEVRVMMRLEVRARSEVRVSLSRTSSPLSNDGQQPGEPQLAPLLVLHLLLVLLLVLDMVTSDLWLLTARRHRIVTDWRKPRPSQPRSGHS